jgi:DNA-binding Lrp family transcriptional regulator
MSGEGRARSKNVRRPRADVELDSVDRQILAALADDARIPNNTLAAAVGVAPSTCLMRVRRLQDAGVIAGYRAELNAESLGRPLQALISVRLHGHARGGIGEAAARYARLPGVLNVFFLAGANDFLLHVAVASPGDLRHLVVDNLSASKEVAATETNVIFEHVAAGSGALVEPPH